MQDIFRRHIIDKIAGILSLEPDSLESALTLPPRPEMGEYAFGCFIPAKALKTNPKEIAERVAAEFGDDEFILEVKPVGPYANFYVRHDRYQQWMLGEIASRRDSFGHSEEGEGKTVVIDFSSPNIAKPLGVHHLRSTMIGHSLRNIFQTLGYKVVAVNHLGDWGTQFGHLMTAYLRYGGDKEPEGDSIAKLNELYVRFHAECEDKPELAEEGRKWFHKLEQGDPQAVELWERFRKVSLEEFERIYRILGVEFDSYAGESHYGPLIPDTLKMLEDKGLTKISEDALIVDLEEHSMPPYLLRKRDEATLYATREVAAALYRHRTYNFSLMLYVVGADQRLHFRQLFKVLELMGCDWAANCAHVDFGLMRFDKAKMSTRRGTGRRLEDLLEEAAARANEIIESKNPDLRDKENVARQVGIGAVVFADLKSKRVKDIDFKWEDALSFDGDSGPYLQYTQARFMSILRKYGKPVTGDVDFGRLTEDEELKLARMLARYPETLGLAASACEPAVISQYLLELAAMANAYYHKHRVIGEDADLAAARALLVDCVRQVIVNGLGILGVAVPDEM